MTDSNDLQTQIDILNDTSLSEQERVDACHALGEISDPAAIGALINTLVDRDPGVRWAAAEALSRHGVTATEPLLVELETHPADQRLYESAHHVLSGITEPSIQAIVQPVIDALEENAAREVDVPVATFNALGELRKYSA